MLNILLTALEAIQEEHIWLYFEAHQGLAVPSPSTQLYNILHKARTRIWLGF